MTGDYVLEAKVLYPDGKTDSSSTHFQVKKKAIVHYWWILLAAGCIVLFVVLKYTSLYARILLRLRVRRIVAHRKKQWTKKK
jgi:hypothetical protein